MRKGNAEFWPKDFERYFVTLSLEELEDLLIRSAKLGAEQALRKYSPPAGGFFTKKQVAEYLGVSISTVDRFMNLGLPYVKFTDGGFPNFRKSEVDQWIVGLKSERQSTD